MCADWKVIRAAFVAFIKEEDSMREQLSRYSLKQHWTGPERGFADHQLQQRYKDFTSGWKARP